MPKHFSKEFGDEGVRLARTSGRTRREIADDLGIGLSTLTRWISRRRDQEIEMPDGAAFQDMTSELKRLCRENEILRQVRDILKKDTAFSPGREVDEVPARP
jgi:transposase